MTKEKQLIECVPNYSEGRDMSIIRQITDAIESVDGISLLNVDPGEATNRTVVTFVGEPQAVCEAAFRGAKKAGEVIDMRRHHGAHPRMGATDVLPLIPVSGITLEECAVLARQLAERMANEAGIPCYCYEAAAFKPERKNLAVCRSGEYEALQEKLTTPGRQPDYMPPFAADAIPESILRTGCTAVGARDFLIAVNFNLNTTSTRRANAIAFDVREKGRPAREGDTLTGAIIRDADGNAVMKPGTLKCTKAIGWYIDEYGIAQVSMNMTNLSVTPLHTAFDEVCRCAQARGIRVTGTEIVGLVPKKTLIDAGKYFLEKQQRSVGIPEEDIIKIAIKSMGLDDLRPFNPREKVIEYLLEDKAGSGSAASTKLLPLSVKDFALETSRESPAPGGGTIAAYMGALAASLGTMVANLSAHKRGWDDRWEEFSQWAAKGQDMITQLLALVEEDTAAFNTIMEAFAMPKKTDEEKTERQRAIQQATIYATQVPLRTMRTASQAFDICLAMAKDGLSASVSDAGVGALAARAAVLGAGLNVRINAAQLEDRTLAEQFIAEADDLSKQAEAAEREILAIVESKL